MLQQLLAAAQPSTTTFVWACFTALIGLVWLRRHLQLNRAHLDPVLTPKDAEKNNNNLPQVTILVAAKDEQDNIESCIKGLLNQQYPNLQIIIINDRSDDRTGEIIDHYARQNTNLTAVHVHELPPGWFGKNHAMHTGVQQATANWLCFSDADCTYDSPNLITAAMSFARKQRVEFLSVLPRLKADSFWEKVVQPVAGAVMVFWFPPQRVNNPKSKCAYANGAFMLITRDAYNKIGGHTAVKATLNEDMHLARYAKRNDVPLAVIRAQDLYTVRMYTGFKQIWRGWSRIFYGCFGTFPRLLVSAVMLAVFSVSPYLTLILSPLAGPGTVPLAAAAAFAVLAQQSVLWRFYKLSGIQTQWALSYPIGAAICLGMTINAMTKTRGAGTTWRGTSYQGGAFQKTPPTSP